MWFMIATLSPNTVPMDPQNHAAGQSPIDIGFTPQNTVIVNPSTGAVHAEQPDGSVTISFGKTSSEQKDTKFDDNLTDMIDEGVLNTMGDEILRGIEEDERSRTEWEDTYNRGIDLLGLKLEEPSSDVSAQGSISKVHHPLLIEAVVRYQANAGAELLPSSGPVKVRDDEPGMDIERVALSEAFEKDFNHYLTVVRKEYYPDTRRMFFAQGFCGNGFKKIYRCPIRKAPVSDYVAAKDLIVSNDAVSLSNASRVTHRTPMRHSVMKRLQLNGHFRDCDLTQPVSSPTSTDQKIAEIEGIDKRVNLPSDHPYTLYECYTEYDIPGFEHMDDDGDETGLPLPYRVTIDKDSRKILEVRRNWKEDDDDCLARQRFVKYGYIPGLGFYDYGLVHLLGQTTRALTAIERQLIDAGQFSNFPGLLLSDVGGRQETTQIRVPPGGGHVIKTGGMPLSQVVMALPYKEPSGVLVNIAKAVEDNGRRLGGTAEVQVGEGRADVPVGTTIAMIEQSTKVEGAVHKQNHESQQQEFLLLKELFEEDPEALWKFARNPARKWQQSQEVADVELVPASDPNTPSHIHRIMKATALAQLSQQFPTLFNERAVATLLLITLGYTPSTLLNPPTQQAPQGPPPDPAKMAMAQVSAAKVEEKKEATMINAQLKAKQIEADVQENQADRESREKIQSMKTMSTLAQQDKQNQETSQQQERQQRASQIEQAMDHQKDLTQQAIDNAHEKDVAASDNNMVS